MRNLGVLSLVLLIGGSVVCGVRHVLQKAADEPVWSAAVTDYRPVMPSMTLIQPAAARHMVTRTRTPQTEMPRVEIDNPLLDHSLTLPMQSVAAPMFTMQGGPAPLSNEFGEMESRRKVSSIAAGFVPDYNNIVCMISAPFAESAPRVAAVSGDLRPFSSPRKAPPTGNDDDEGGNTMIDAEVPVGDGLACMVLCALCMVIVTALRRRKSNKGV